jgi:hypothetical protein
VLLLCTLDSSYHSASSAHSVQPMSNRGDRTFYGILLTTLIGFFCFSVYTGHSGDNPYHDFESKPVRKASRGQSK